MNGLEKLKSGDFNDMMQEQLPDGSVIITLSSSNYPEVYKFRVKDLYGPNEEVLDAGEDRHIPKGDLRKPVPEVPKEAKGHGRKKGG